MFQRYIDQQYRRPSGLVGRWIGRKMATQHRAENLWTVDLLDVQPTDKLLEVGFGPGFAIHEIAQSLTTGMIAGVDFSKTMVAAAKRTNAKAVRAGRVDVRYGDVTSLPFEDRSFDKAFSINSIYFWMEPRKALQELARVLKPGGLLVMTFLPLERWDTAAYGVPVANATFKPYSLDELKTLFTQAGFINLAVHADENLQNRSNCSVIGQKPL